MQATRNRTQEQPALRDIDQQIATQAAQMRAAAEAARLDAEARLRETGRNSKSAKPLLDAVAAQLILQTWFESAQHVIPTQPSA